jgi:hypothetical protein
MASKVRETEIFDTATAVRKWPRRMFGEEGPDVEIFNATPLPNEMLGTALAEADHHQPVLVEFARLRSPRE